MAKRIEQDDFSPQTEFGRQLVDIVDICARAGMESKAIHAALLGHIGVCAACWGEPPYYAPQYAAQPSSPAGDSTEAKS